MRIPRIPQYEAKGYVDGFESKAQELFASCFGGRLFDRETWDWQFNKNPVGNRRITTLWDNDILVALTALTPSFAYLDGVKVLSAVSGTTMARNDYRGVSIQLVQESANQNKDIEFKYSFPNKQAFRIATQFYGHHYVGDIAFWSTIPSNRTISHEIRKFDKFELRHEMLCHELINQHKYIKERTADYMNWRLVSKPHLDYEMYEIENKGYIVFDEYSDEGEKHFQIVDLISVDMQSFYNLCEFAINEAYKRKDDLIKIWMTSDIYTPVLHDLGFVYGLHPFKMTVWDRDIALNKSYITMIDSDVF